MLYNTNTGLAFLPNTKNKGENMMKKRTKILSILLALLLTATLVPTAFVQAFASDYEWDDSASYDEPYDDPSYKTNIESIEITKAPNNTVVTKDFDGSVDEEDLKEGLELLIKYDDGTSYNYSYDEDRFAFEGYGIELKIQGATGDWNRVLENLPLGETEITYELLGCTATQKITVLENEYVLNPYNKFELTKAPTKEFTVPCFNKLANTEEEWIEYREMAEKPENRANSIAYHMSGAELTFYRANGIKETYKVTEKSMIYCLYSGVSVEAGGLGFGYIAEYRLYPLGYEDTPGVGMSPEDSLFITVADLGNFKAQISLKNLESDSSFFTAEFTVNQTGAGETPTTPATPGEVVAPTKPVPTDSQSGTNSTSDTATKDTAASVNSGNGTVATGNTAVSAILLTALLAAIGIMLVIGRKKEIL